MHDDALVAAVSTEDGICSSILAIGVPVSLGPLLMSAASILLMARYGPGYMFAKVTMITSTVCMGMCQGAQPLLGYCVGARQPGRFRDTLQFSLRVSFGPSAAMTGWCNLFAEPIVRTFLIDPTACGYGL